MPKKAGYTYHNREEKAKSGPMTSKTGAHKFSSKLKKEKSHKFGTKQ